MAGMSADSPSTSTGTFVRGKATVVTEAAELQTITRAFRKVGKPVVLVPTMGALHSGHLSLVTAAQRVPGALVVVSIFVNPLQFAANEDLDSYPRTLDADVEKLRAAGVDVVFAPNARTMYPNGPRTTIHPGEAGSILEGKTRPTHFAGVLTVVNKLFALSHCSHAFFGEKDYQQLVLIQQMVTDLNIEVIVRGVPIVRESTGLALSSRNAYLSDDHREAAISLSAALAAGVHVADQGHQAVLDTARGILEANPDIEIDYVALRGVDLGEAPEEGDARLLIAARVGTTRLIDNAPLSFGDDNAETTPTP